MRRGNHARWKCCSRSAQGPGSYMECRGICCACECHARSGSGGGGKTPCSCAGHPPRSGCPGSGQGAAAGSKQGAGLKPGPRLPSRTLFSAAFHALPLTPPAAFAVSRLPAPCPHSVSPTLTPHLVVRLAAESPEHQKHDARGLHVRQRVQEGLLGAQSLGLHRWSSHGGGEVGHPGGELQLEEGGRGGAVVREHPGRFRSTRPSPLCHS